jgi:hypothetical protein
MFHYHHNDSSSNLIINSNSNNITPRSINRQQNQSRYSRKQKIKDYLRREILKFFGVDAQSEDDEKIKWLERQKRLALRCFGQLRDDMDIQVPNHGEQQLGFRPDILPAQNAEECERITYKVMKKPSVITMVIQFIAFLACRRTYCQGNFTSVKIIILIN